MPEAKDGSRPAVLYSAVQHAREWLAGETERRTLRLFLDNYGQKGTAVGTDGQPVAGVSSTRAHEAGQHARAVVHPDCKPRRLRLHVHPDNRLWRKNLRDNNGDGQITAVDGVDPNRNFPTRWGYDNEGSYTTRRARPTAARARPPSPRPRRSCR